MALILGILACLGLWWLSRNAGRLSPRLTAALLRRVGAWTALILAGLFLLRGRLDLALVLGLGGVWLLEGARDLGRRLGRLLPRARPARRFRSATIELSLAPDGSIATGRILAGPEAGRSLDSLGPAARRDLLGYCRARDPDGARLLEAYLDRRHPGWRVDAQGDPDPRAGRTAGPGPMTEEEAHQILGLQRGASPEEIRAAHRALMKRAHPDQGGSVADAARLNAARDRLTNRHR
ncbi:J domain-containing protein [Methylobacterium sp. A54F]